MRIRFAGTLAAVLLWTTGATLRADDVSEFLEEVDGRYYSPAANGAEDLHCHLVWESMTDGTFNDKPPMVVNLYWKAPDLRRCKIEHMAKLLGEDVAGMEQSTAPMIDDIVRESFAEKAKRFTFTLADDGDMKKLEGVPKEGTPEAKDSVTKWTWWFDDDLKLVKSLKEDVLGATRWDMTWKDQDGLHLLQTRKETMITKKDEIPMKEETFEYQEVEGVGLVPVKIVEERLAAALKGIKVETKLTDYEANTGLADDLFPAAGK